MSIAISETTKAILLLTAPLIVDRVEPAPDLLSPGEFNRLLRDLNAAKISIEDLVSPEPGESLEISGRVIDADRLKRLLGRGFLLGQAVERWVTRSIWIVSRSESGYPACLRERLGQHAPPILYGCGDPEILGSGGLAVVGSRHVDDELIGYTEEVGALAARSGRTIVSGGARGIDQAAMRGALEAGGRVAGVLADSLERAALARDHRAIIMEGRLVLVSPYDPSAGFNVGHAMQRNKLIYALSNAALIVSSDYQKGGTWAGAIEQLDKLKLVPIYIRSNGDVGKGLEALMKRGAAPWPNPTTPEAFEETIDRGPAGFAGPEEKEQLFSRIEEVRERDETGKPSGAATNAAEELFSKVKELLARMDAARTDAEVALDLDVSRTQARAWLQRLVKEGVLVKLSKPVRYRAAASEKSLFE